MPKADEGELKSLTEKIDMHQTNLTLPKAAEKVLSMDIGKSASEAEQKLLATIANTGLTNLSDDELELLFSSKSQAISYLKNQYADEFKSLKNSIITSITTLKR